MPAAVVRSVVTTLVSLSSLTCTQLASPGELPHPPLTHPCASAPACCSLSEGKCAPGAAHFPRTIPVSPGLHPPLPLKGHIQEQKTNPCAFITQIWGLLVTTELAPSCHWTGEGSGTPLRYSCLENPMDRGAWWAAVHGVATSRERLHFHFSLSCIGEGNGNPLQCSCLENPRDGGA